MTVRYPIDKLLYFRHSATWRSICYGFYGRNPFRVSRTNFQSQTIATPMEWLLDLLICSWRPSENDYGIGRQTVCSCVATNASFLLFSMSTMSFWLDKVSYRTQTLEISACSAGSTMLNFNPSAVAFKKIESLAKASILRFNNNDGAKKNVPIKARLGLVVCFTRKGAETRWCHNLCKFCLWTSLQ